MYSAKILADSLNTYNNSRLTTFEITYPRFVHSEFLTHRMISRNSASSRAIPVAKMLQRIKDDPVIPVWWGKAQSGMQANEEIDEAEKKKALKVWLDARDLMVVASEALVSLGLHKQIPNRLTEPWMWITVIASATDWTHFFNLRAHKDAQPEIQKIAYMMLDLYKLNEPKPVGVGGWHLPLWLEDDVLPVEYLREIDYPNELFKAEVSAGRCARVSYLTHHGARDFEEDRKLCFKLTGESPMHASPLEHPAKAMTEDNYIGNFRGWKQLRKSLDGEYTNKELLVAAASTLPA